MTEESPSDVQTSDEEKVVTIFGAFVDVDAERFEASMKPFEERTGIDVQYEGSGDFESLITVRVEGGDRDSGVRDPQGDQARVPQLNHGQHSFAGHRITGFPQGDVRGQHHQPQRTQQQDHPVPAGSGDFAENLGLPLVGVGW